MARPSYRWALDWIARNDDCDWLCEPIDDVDDYPLSVTASLVADLFDVPEKQLVADLRKAVIEAWPEYADKYRVSVIARPDTAKG